jgi:hypothetical protein
MEAIAGADEVKRFLPRVNEYKDLPVLPPMI